MVIVHNTISSASPDMDDIHPQEDHLLSQQKVIDFLTGGEPFNGQTVDRIDTHISHVFLVGERVYKMKRAIQLSFLNYLSLEDRHKACQREIDLNRRTAPNLYLSVVAVTRQGDGFQLGGDGEPVEWLVEMERFDQKTIFDQLVTSEGLSTNLIFDLAEQIARFHLGAERTKEMASPAANQEVINGVSRSLRLSVGSVFLEDTVQAWSRGVNAQLQDLAHFINTRRRMGFVRRCHGDLHLGNICLMGGRPTLFDAIEFNDEFSCIDVIYDLAFVLMDLIQFDRKDLANLLLNRYLELTGDYSGTRLLRLFLSLRAAVRARVFGLRARTDLKDLKSRQTAQDYLDLAGKLLHKEEPALIAIGGLSGSGKSTLAYVLASRLVGGVGAVVLRSDTIRKHLFGRPALVPLPSEAYTPQVNERVYRTMIRDAHRALTAGQFVIVDATFMDAHARSMAESVAAKKDVPFRGFWLEADKNHLVERVNARAGDVSDSTEDVICKQLRRDCGDIGWTKIDANGSIEETCTTVLDMCK